MMRLSAAVLVLGVVGGSAFAQTSPTSPSASPPTVTSPALPSVKSSTATSTMPSSSQTAAAPVSGANSFTEAQARSRIERDGYSAVTGLVKDDKGIWRGKAMKGASSVGVSLDYQGNVVVGQP